mgnify:CR=1 FL=1
MAVCAGLVGLPNVGKSTLFNALTKSSVPAANYPFCTIDPHTACTAVPDERSEVLKGIYKSGKIISSTVEFVDIAGLVKGAASGEGLGNQFLSHIRDVDLVIHVLRCFEDIMITYSRDELDPLIDFEIIVTELMLKDLESVEKRAAKVEQLIKSAKQKPAELKELELEAELIKQLKVALNNVDNVQVRKLIKESKVQTTPLLSAKNYMIVANISEDEIQDEAYKNNKHYQKLVSHFGADNVIPVCAKLESELAQLAHEEAEEMASMMGIKVRGLDQIISKTYKNLGLITFFTCGPKEIHAWPIKAGINVRAASGEIHSDLEKGFICATVFNYKDIAEAKTEAVLKNTGKIRTEGQDYIVQDGDILDII